MTTNSLFWMNLLLTCVAITACAGKPFQPPPPTFKQFSKANSTDEEVKRSMDNCGYLDVYTGRNEGDKVSDIITRQNCMFKKGFSYADGWKGLCFERAFRHLSECQSLPPNDIK